MSEKCLFLPLKVFSFPSKYDFLTPSGPLYYLPTKYRNFAQSPFNVQIEFYNFLSFSNEYGQTVGNYQTSVVLCFTVFKQNEQIYVVVRYFIIKHSVSNGARKKNLHSQPTRPLRIFFTCSLIDVCIFRSTILTYIPFNNFLLFSSVHKRGKMLENLKRPVEQIYVLLNIPQLFESKEAQYY